MRNKTAIVECCEDQSYHDHDTVESELACIHCNKHHNPFKREAEEKMYTVIYAAQTDLIPDEVKTVSSEEAANLLRNVLIRRIKEYEDNTIVVWYDSLLIGARITIQKEKKSE